jgi:hypothetical protein
MISVIFQSLQDQKLMVPVVRNARICFPWCWSRYQTLSRARDGQITVDDMTGEHLQSQMVAYLVLCCQHLY